MEDIRLSRQKELTALLKKASEAYYANDEEILSNYEYDKLYDELVLLEEATGIVFTDSPTVNVGYEAVTSLPRETHPSPMLSLDKTKDRGQFIEFIGNNPSLLSWKMDGLTIVLTYNDGKLTKAITRGNGIVGEIVTSNAKTFKNIPVSISYKGELVIRGEAIIKYSDFEKINETITDGEAKYKNPRNLCSGSVRQLNSAVTAKRNVYFYAFSLVSAQDVDFENSRDRQMKWLGSIGFETVEYKVVTAENAGEAMDYFAEKIETNDFPSDGLVAIYDDIAYGDSLGTTAKFPRNAYAFKWADEIRETVLKEVEWSPSRTGLINPVAIFEPVELEGTTVSRASVHNVSIVKSLKLGIGDKILVYKANMIIPQISENLTKSGTLQIPDICPVCGGKTVITSEGEKGSDAVEVLKCPNPDCAVKKILSFDLFVSRNAMNVEGLSEQTLEKFISKKFINNLGDIFELSKYKDEIVAMEGFGETSYTNIINEVEKCRNCTLASLLYGLGIPNVGVATAKIISEYFDEDIDKIKNATAEEYLQIDSIGGIIANAMYGWFNDEHNLNVLEQILKYVNIVKAEKNENQLLAGLTFVITGSLKNYVNRDALKAIIEKNGGKVSSGVSAKTNYLINNNVKSTSGKNKKALELGIPIISEEDFIKLIEE